jgi:uncharacterized Zn finger protein (UPF0148 family)
MEYAEQVVECPWCGQITRLVRREGRLDCLNCRRTVSKSCEEEGGADASRPDT